MEMQARNVVVTGGASGIGKATALLLAREGARVFVGDVDERGGQAVAAQAAGEGLAIEFLPLDLTQSATIGAFAAAVHRRVERVDGLVNGAGWDRIQPFLENPPEMWDQLIAINLLGAVRLTFRATPGGSAAPARRYTPPPRAASSRSPNPWRARWRAIISTSTASAPARPIRRSSRTSPSGCAKP